MIVNPKIEIRNTSIRGKGLFSLREIKKDEVLFDWEGGTVYEAEKCSNLPKDTADHVIQFEEHKWIYSDGLGTYVNHSCNPNAGISGKFKLVAMKDMRPNEEIFLDYDMTEDSDWSMECNCCSNNCRKVIKGFRFLPGSSRVKYKGYISEWIVNKYHLGMPVHVFIDAANIWEVQKAKGKFFDFGKLVRYIQEKFVSPKVKLFYYTAYPAEGTRNYSLDGKHRLYTFLKKNLEFIVRKKELKRISVATSIGQTIEEKGNMDVEITIDVLHFLKEYKIAIFFSGDSDFLALMNYLKRGGKRVYVYSSRNNVSEELRTGGDGYFDILKIEDDIWGKELVRRPV